MKKLAVGLVALLALAPSHSWATAAADHTATTPAAATADRAGMGAAPAAGRTVVGTVRLMGMAPTPAAASDDHGAHDPVSGHRDLILIAGTESWLLTGKQPRPNMRVRVTGTVSGHTLHANAVTEISAAPAPVPPRGTSRVLVMLAHWSTPDHVTQESARQQMFSDSDAWFRDVSYGKVGLTGDVTPWMRIDGPDGGRCYSDSATIMTQAKAAATALGYEPEVYDNVVVYFPNNGWQPGSDCNAFAGWAYVGAAGTWLNGYMDRRVTVHELGHNYGLWHSHSYICSNVLSGACGFQEYGDPFDAMGSSGYVGHFSASQKRLLGWLDGRLADLSDGGSATLAPMASDGVTTKAVRVAVSGNRTYWLEYRQALDYDSTLPAEGTDGVLVHVTDPTIAFDGGSNLIDVRPSDGGSTFSATLRPGTSWRSPEGFRFSVGAVTTAGAAVTVETGTGPRCPDLSVEPDTAGNAPVVPVPTTQKRGFCTNSDQDWVRFDAVAGERYRLETANLATGVDTVLAVFTGDGSTLLASDDNTVGKASRIIFGPETSGTYLLRVEQANGVGDDTYAYDLRLALAGGGGEPTVTERTPEPGAVSVVRSANITATFSENVTGVGTKTFTLQKAGSSSAVKASVSRVSGTDQWVLNPGSDLTSDTRYTVTLTGGGSAIRDADGNPLETTSWTFGTGQRPTVTSRTPAVDASNVSRTAPVTVTFSEDVIGVDGTSFTLRNATTEAAVPTRVIRKDDDQWVLDPQSDLAADTRYTVTLTGGPAAVRDRAGNPLITTSWSFATGPVPTVTSRVPGSNAKDVSRTASVTVTFSEPVTGVDYGSFRLKDKSGKVVDSTVTRDGNTNRWILNPVDTLKASTKYTVQLTGGPSAIRDAAGNALTSTTWTFTTKR